MNAGSASCDSTPRQSLAGRSARAVAIAQLPPLFGTRQTIQQCPQALGQPGLDNVTGFFAEFSADFL
jgi:hypothetical protein